MDILNIVSWVKLNFVDITTVIAYVVAIASIIVKLTPTPKDNVVLDKVIAFISKYIALNK